MNSYVNLYSCVPFWSVSYYFPGLAGGNPKPRSGASRRHSSRRATTYGQHGLQQAAEGLRGPRGRGQKKIRQQKRYDHFRDALVRKLANIKSGVSEWEIRRYLDDSRETECPYQPGRAGGATDRQEPQGLRRSSAGGPYHREPGGEL